LPLADFSAAIAAALSTLRAGLGGGDASGDASGEAPAMLPSREEGTLARSWFERLANAPAALAFALADFIPPPGLSTSELVLRLEVGLRGGLRGGLLGGEESGEASAPEMARNESRSKPFRRTESSSGSIVSDLGSPSGEFVLLEQHPTVLPPPIWRVADPRRRSVSSARRDQWTDRFSIC
jgi:hypothetical protein